MVIAVKQLLETLTLTLTATVMMRETVLRVPVYQLRYYWPLIG